MKKKISVLIIDSNNKQNYFDRIKEEFLKSDLDAEIFPYSEYNSDYLVDFVFVDWNYITKLSNVKCKNICVTSNSEDSSIPKYAMEKGYMFFYKPFKYNRIQNLIRHKEL